MVKYWRPSAELNGSGYFYGRTDCLDVDTKIYIFEDNKLTTKKLSELPKNFEVLSFNFDNNKKIKAHAEKIYSGEKELYEIEFSNGTKVYASTNHKFFDKNGNEIKVKDIKVGDVLFKKNCHLIGENNPAKRKEVREKISKAVSREKNGFYGKKQSLKHKLAMLKFRGENNPAKRKEVREKIKESNKWFRELPKEEKLKHFKNPETAFNKGIPIWKNKEHPKGMLNKKHNEETKKRISKSYKKYRKEYGMKNKDTSIELKIQKFLKLLNIKFEKHKLINDIKHKLKCDIFVPSKKLVIECDGEYWHNYPYGTDLDIIRNVELRSKDYKIIRLWERDINRMKINEFTKLIENV